MNRRSTRVVLVFPGNVDGVGGAEVQALLYARYADPNRVHVSISLLGTNPTFTSRAATLGVDVDHVVRHDWHPWDPRVGVAYARAIRRVQPDIVHLYGLRQEIMTRIVTSLACRTKIVSAIRGLESHRTWVHTFLNRATGRWVDLWISNSRVARNLFIERDGLPSDRIIVVPNGVELPDPVKLEMDRRSVRKELGISENEVAVICVANHFPDKRIDDLIKAVGTHECREAGIRLFVVGRCTEHTCILEQAISDVGCGDRVILLGYRQDATRLMAGMDMMALASAKEGMPASLLEGMASGLPVVATPVASITELVRDGENGHLVPIGDINGFARLLAGLAKDSNIRRIMGRRSRAIVEADYSAPLMADRLTAIYEHVVSRGNQ